jgi:negative regulator of flagellin synthesis FlgM
MEIDGRNPLAGLNSNLPRIDVQTPNQRVQRTSEESPSSDNDRIELSVRSREILHLDEMIRSTPDIREAKVEQVRSAIQNGTYNVRAEKIADKIIGGNLIDEVF